MAAILYELPKTKILSNAELPGKKYWNPMGLRIM